MCFRQIPLATVWRVVRRGHQWGRKPGGGEVGAWAGAVVVEGEAFMHDACLEEEGERAVSMTRPGFLVGVVVLRWDREEEQVWGRLLRVVWAQ